MKRRKPIELYLCTIACNVRPRTCTVVGRYFMDAVVSWTQTNRVGDVRARGKNVMVYTN